MTWQTHFLGGIASLSLLALVPHDPNSTNTGVLAAVAGFAALLPDLDAVRSKIRSLEVAHVRPFNPIGGLLNAQFGHRGFLHSPWALMIVGGASVGIDTSIGVETAFAFFLGYSSHLLLDGCTKTGIPGFRGRFWVVPPSMRVATGSVEEGIYFGLVTTFVFAAFGICIRGGIGAVL